MQRPGTRRFHGCSCTDSRCHTRFAPREYQPGSHPAARGGTGSFARGDGGELVRQQTCSLSVAANGKSVDGRVKCVEEDAKKGDRAGGLPTLHRSTCIGT